MLSEEREYALGEIWCKVMDDDATGDEILDYLDSFRHSRYYGLLSDSEQSFFDAFKVSLVAHLADFPPEKLLYRFVEFFTSDYGWSLPSEY